MANILLILPATYNSEDDRIARRILRDHCGFRMISSAICECCGAIHLKVNNLHEQRIRLLCDNIVHDLLQQNIDADIVVETAPVHRHQLNAN